MLKSTLTSKGRVTIPKEVRQRLGLRPGDQLIFRFDEKGRLMVEPAIPNPLGGIVGFLHKYAGKRPVTIEEMDEAVLKRAAQKFADETKR